MRGPHQTRFADPRRTFDDEQGPGARPRTLEELPDLHELALSLEESLYAPFACGGWPSHRDSIVAAVA
jgi:hypothetical protein